MKKFFLCFVCGLLATSTTGVLWVLNSIVFPVYNAFLELGSHMLSYFTEMQDGKFGIDRMIYIPFEGEVEAQYNAACSVPHMDPATIESFPQAPKQMMECLICAVNERLNFGYKLGWTILSQDGFMALICGLIMMALFLFIKIGFVFYLVDTVFRFAMMVLILPLLIMAYAFKPTQKWTTKGFLTILNSAAFMMCIAIVILMAMAAIQQILLDNKELLENDAASLADFSKPLLLLLLIGFLLIGSLNIAKTIADALIGGGGSANFQKQFGTAALKTAKWAIIGITGGIGGAIVDHSAKLRSVRDSLKQGKARMNAFAASLTGGSSDDDDDDD